MINFDKDKCTGCKVCINICPQGVIALNNKKAVLLDYDSCLECGACQLNCEYDAIELSKGTGCLFAIIKEDIFRISSKNTGCGCSTNIKKGGS